MPRPNFLIVGAPKCGTTAMYEYLRRQPDVFMPEYKEPHYFADDIEQNTYVRCRERYDALFQPAGGAHAIGEASVWYLYSRTAARRIRDELGPVRIIAMLRQPVDMLHSLHNQCLLSGNESIRDFAAALEAEPRRRQGRDWPRRRRESRLLYQEVVDFAPQLERYFDAFGRENVLVLRYDHFARDPARAHRDCRAFLGLPEAGDSEFPVFNGSRTVRNLFLQRFVRHPPRWLQTTVRVATPARLRHAVIRRAVDLNTIKAPRTPLPEALRARLTKQLAPQVERLERLLGCDLSAWRTFERPAEAAA